MVLLTVLKKFRMLVTLKELLLKLCLCMFQYKQLKRAPKFLHFVQNRFSLRILKTCFRTNVLNSNLCLFPCESTYNFHYVVQKWNNEQRQSFSSDVQCSSCKSYNSFHLFSWEMWEKIGYWSVLTILCECLFCVPREYLLSASVSCVIPHPESQDSLEKVLVWGIKANLIDLLRTFSELSFLHFDSRFNQNVFSSLCIKHCQWDFGKKEERLTGMILHHRRQIVMGLQACWSNSSEYKSELMGRILTYWLGSRIFSSYIASTSVLYALI